MPDSGDIQNKKRQKGLFQRILAIILQKEGLHRDEAAAIGDGATGEIMLKNAGFGIAFYARETLKNVAYGRLRRENLKGLLFCLGVSEKALPNLI